ncbi:MULTISPECIES: hypothetical protein [unclassified Lentimonas]|uniref:hypothetical protein n=1 Tax=unclassified Lentimonas TaxID=2630993 RepID=UPI001320F0CD|nr:MULTISPECIES: hypothetical protein [unclassified Lentimonas]CAA6679963.1 Unannotated [Lentimonas sp. CC4]CAA6686519.1 Unannotated [Lentimonas sp. CC6]CAA7074795.1 Unannotated [Lentimonas sp. CC4]CAA7169422.1 Unannotated [Lentimonas sp. CC21]CAA7180187.1 Unannotated [Lentimonas sp. CC8]
MNKFLLSIVCAGLSCSAVFAVPFQEIIGEDADFFVTVRSISETREQWETHPIVELFEDEELLDFFDRVAAEDAGNDGDDEEDFDDVLDAFGLTQDELFELFPGQASLAFYKLADKMMGQVDREEMVLMAEFSGDADRLNELMHIQFERNMAAQQEVNPLVEHEMIQESFMGETLYFDETFDGEETYIEDGYAFVDGIVVLAAPESRLRDAVESIKEGASDPIADSDVYRRSREDGGRGDVSVYLNLENLMPPLNTALVDLPMVNNLAMFGVTAQSLQNALSLESLQAMYADLDLIEDGVLAHYGMIYDEKLGFLSLLSYGQGELPEARYVPEGVLSSAVSLFDFSEMLANLEKVLTSASPTLPPLIDMQMQMMQTNTGVDLRSSILENFGSRVVNLSVLNEAGLEGMQTAESQQLFMVELNDSQAFSQAIEAFKDMVPGARAMIETQEYEGQTIYTIHGPSDPNFPEAQQADVSYVMTRSELIVNIGRVGLLHQVLSRMSEGGDGLWQSREIEALFERIEQPNAVTRSYMNAEQMVEPLFRSLLEAGELSGFTSKVSADQIPSDLDVSYRLISEVNEAPDSLFGRTLIIKSEDSE